MLEVTVARLLLPAWHEVLEVPRRVRFRGTCANTAHAEKCWRFSLNAPRVLGGSTLEEGLPRGHTPSH